MIIPYSPWWTSWSIVLDGLLFSHMVKRVSIATPLLSGIMLAGFTLLMYCPGSGKTYTMVGIQKYFAEDLFGALELAASSEEKSENKFKNCQVHISFFEICKYVAV